ncbi:MAG: response regulator [Oscillospiraceae bacterium]
MNKLRALIVDDEFTAREMLKNQVEWEKLGYEPPVLASNGAVALQLCSATAFDIVFTDIEMPIMDGIDFISVLRKTKPNQRIVVISCHEKFDYAQKALRFGVDDYIIKDLITENELKAILCSVSPQKAKQSNTEQAESRLSEILKKASEGIPTENTALPSKYSAVFAIAIDEYDKLVFERGEQELVGTLEAFARSVNCSAMCFVQKDIIYLLSEAPETVSVLYYINDTVSKANAIRVAARRMKLGMITIGASDPISSVVNLVSACKDAREAVNMRVIEGFDKTIMFNSISIKKNMLNFERIDYLLKRIEELSNNDNATCLKFVGKLYSSELSSGFADVNYYKYINIKMWSMLITLSQSKGFSQSEILNEMHLNLDEINRMESSEIMAQFFKTVLMKLVSSDEPEGGESIISAALSLIEKEYTSDISLSYLAEKLHTHKSYLCRIFKEKMGENLMPYIENKRIERAKYLLYNSQMKLSEISESLGFTSPQYFSFVFKKAAGLSPTEFKKTMVNAEPLHTE